jgi:hypothetical protein
MGLPHRHLWLALALCAAGCASRPARPAGVQAGRRADEAEARTEAMSAELRQKQAALQQSFAELARAEAAAGLSGFSCAGATPASTPAPGLPRSGAPHLSFTFRQQAYQVPVNFSSPRSSGGWRIAPANCEVRPR